jgi:DNA polymerase-1
MTDLVIDGDIIVFKSCAASEEATKWEDNVWTLSTNESEACQAAARSIENIIERAASSFKLEKITVMFSSTTNFRCGVDPEYKANRAGKRKPMCIKEVVAYLQDHYRTETWKGLEADDVMGIYATRKVVDNVPDVIVWSPDKDMKTIPNSLYMSDTQVTPVHISQEEADRNWFTQALTGDAVDNYHGIRGVGPVKAKRILGKAEKVKELWHLTKLAFLQNGMTEADALRNVRLARILRIGDYDHQTGEVKLWETAA